MYSVDHIALHVRDLAVSRSFYEFLGGHVVSKPSPHFLEVMLGSQRIHLVTQADAPSAQRVTAGIDHFCLRVPRIGDLAIVAKKLEGCAMIAHYGRPVIEDSPMLNGGRDDHCEERPPLRTLYFKDPDGVNIEIRAYEH